MTNMDKLYEAVAARGPVCVGLDTDFSYLPADFVDTTLTKGENIVRFNKKLIDATKAVAGCYKVQIAYYESLGLEGMKAYADTLKAVREAGVPGHRRYQARRYRQDRRDVRHGPLHRRLRG